MKEIIDIVKRKYNINNEIYICINDDRLLEFKLNDYVSVNIFKIKGDYNLLISIINSNSFPAKKIIIELKYKSYAKLKIDLEYFHFS